MNEAVNKRIDQLKDDIVKSTQKLVQIKSVEAEVKEGMPFGEGVKEALETALKLADILGLKNKNIDNYAGHVEIGRGEEILGILCHLDVVPEGRDWTYPPYSAEIVDNKIYGRGAIDNKGPAVAALYALKAVQDSGIELRKRVRLIFGTDEESGWEGLKYYLEHEETPDFAFSPDAEFPVIHGEKGILTFKLKARFNNQGDGKFIINSIQGGNAPNMVPDYCEAHLRTDYPEELSEKLSKFSEKTGYKLELDEEGEEIIIKSHGISAHGSLPEDGQNAISQLLVFIKTLDLAEDDIGRFIDFYNEKIGMKYHGESIGCELRDELSGPLTFNVGMIRLDNKGAEITVNIRYPVTISKEEVFTGIRAELEGTGVELEEGEHMEPLYVPKDDPLVTKLMKVYQEFTGDRREPITIGGGTYARAIERAVAFGPLFPGQVELAHQRDEYISIDDLILNAKIYANAIIELAKE